ncbi:hypothetical protein RZE82_03365 [Mollicutes bacterium LVI A0039]|nr:hypothetical protein RZE82_03365 [Mollicutes bacterium LVI A0039]
MNLEELESIFDEIDLKYIDEQNIIIVKKEAFDHSGNLIIDNTEFNIMDDMHEGRFES